MSLDKAIYYGKEYREPYYRSGRFDMSCRPHGSCGYCRCNRFHANYVRMMIADDTAEGVYKIKGRKIVLGKDYSLF
jgi:hypothetical protein